MNRSAIFHGLVQFADRSIRVVKQLGSSFGFHGEGPDGLCPAEHEGRGAARLVRRGCLSVQPPVRHLVRQTGHKSTASTAHVLDHISFRASHNDNKQSAAPIILRGTRALLSVEVKRPSKPHFFFCSGVSPSARHGDSEKPCCHLLVAMLQGHNKTLK